jgi:hypothetical protein
VWNVISLLYSLCVPVLFVWSLNEIKERERERGRRERERERGIERGRVRETEREKMAFTNS